MLIPLALIIINTLMIIGINSNLSIITNQYENTIKIDNMKKFVLQEKAIENAVNSYCLKNLELCTNEIITNNEISISTVDLEEYIPLRMSLLKFGNNFYKDIKLDYLNDTIIIEHEVTDTNVKNKYLNHYLQKNTIFICKDGESLPCTGSIIKNSSISNILKTKIEDKKTELMAASS